MTFSIILYIFLFFLVNVVIKYSVLHKFYVGIRLPKNKKLSDGLKLTPIFELVHEKWFLHETYVVIKHEIGYHYKETIFDILLNCLIPILNVRLMRHGYGETDRYDFYINDKKEVLEIIGDRTLEELFGEVVDSRANMKSTMEKEKEYMEERFNELNRTYKENYE